MEFIDQLSLKETEFFKCLENVDPESLWGLAISNVVKKPDVSKFRSLVCDLKSQANDCAEVMQDVLGKQCFDNLLSL